MATIIGELLAKLGLDSSEYTKGVDGVKGSVTDMVMAMNSLKDVAGDVHGFMDGQIRKTAAAWDVQVKAEKSAFRAFGEGAKDIIAQAGELQGVSLFGDEVSLQAAVMGRNLGLIESEVKGLLPVLQDTAQATGQDLPEAFKKVGDAVISNSLEPLKEAGIGFDEATKKMFSMSSQAEQVSFLMAELKNRFEGAAAGARDTAAGAMVAYENALGDLDEQIGSLLDKPMAEMYKGMESAVIGVTSAISSLSPEFKSLLGTIGLGVASAAGFTLSLVTLGATVGKVQAAWPLLTGALKTGAGALKAAGSGFLSLGKAMLPIAIKAGLVLAAIAGLVLIIGAMKQAWDANLFGIKDTVEKVFNWIGGAYDKVEEWTLSWAQKLGEYIDKIKQAFVDAFNWIQKVTGMGTKIEIGEGAGIGGEKGESRGALGDTLGGIKGTAKAGLDVLKPLLDALGNAGKAVKEFVFGVGTATKEMEQTKEESIGLLKGSAQAEVDAKSAHNEAVKAANALHKTLMDKHLADQDKYQKDLEAKRLKEADVVEARVQLGNDILAAGRILVDGLLSMGGEVGGMVKAGISGAAQGGPIGAIVAVIMEVVSKFESVMKAVELMDEGVKMIAEAFSPIFDGLVSLNQMVNESLGEMLQELTEGGFMDALKSVFDALFKALGPILKVINKTIGLLLTSITPVLELLGEILGAFASVIEVVSEIFEAITDVFKAFTEVLKPFNIIFKILGEVLKVFGEAVGWIAGIIKDIIGGIMEAVEVVVKFFNDMFNEINKFLRSIGINIGGGEPEAEIIGGAQVSRQVDEVTYTDLDDNASGAASALEALKDTTKEVNQSLSNLPAGFKLVEAKLNSIAAVNEGYLPANLLGPSDVGANNFGEHTGALGDGSNMVFNIDKVVTTAKTSEELGRDLKEQAEWNNTLTYGATSRSGFNAGSM